MPPKTRKTHALAKSSSSTGSYYPSDDDDHNHLSQSPNVHELEEEENQNYDHHHVSDFQSESISISSATRSEAALSNSSPTSYVNIAPLPVFHGSPQECPVTHLSRFAKVCRANIAWDVETMMRIFPVTLDDEAGLWYDLNVEPYPSLGWEEIKASFVQAYSKPRVEEQLRNELSTMNQGSEESVRSYFLRLQWVLQRWPGHGISENLLKDIFVDGLREECQDWVIPRKPESMEEALRLAFAFEQLKTIRVSSWKRNQRNEQDEISNEDEARDRVNGKTMMSLCRCSKHHCWKKQLQRSNNSLVSRYSNAL